MLIDIDGTDIHIVEPEIQGTEKTPALLFIHGAGGDASAWTLQTEFFKGKYPVYLMELPGHGGSGGSGEEEIPAYAEWVRKALKQIVPDTPALAKPPSDNRGTPVQTGFRFTVAVLLPVQIQRFRSGDSRGQIFRYCKNCLAILPQSDCRRESGNQEESRDCHGKQREAVRIAIKPVEIL